ncbi:mitochondrial ribonuclease P catalytic subunit-like [Argiope bruennichi]|uniref:Mitochondrial ribonuclease P catalytic subunit n=1 Tax=Argiope bruennichi TaxID=94029 RepID=A0A8T0G0D9_ARGBR|nr:mitochondrial ribonuclease P catalytic subunit-like [Argiope bruennichi]KAF8795888.1 Mitochondrial ribonuclease P catalytic like protein [Argiope bruennichi]
MFAIRRLQCRRIFKSKFITNQLTSLLENPLELPPKFMCFTREAQRRNPALPSFNEGSFASRYFPTPIIERTEERIKEIVSQREIRTTEDWNEIKNELFIDFEILSEVNFSSIVMNCLLMLDKINEAHSFMKYLKDVNMEPNFLTYLKYMALCGKNVDQCGEEIIFQTFKKVQILIDSSPVLDIKRTEHVIQGFSATSQWRKCFDYLEKIPCDPNFEIVNCLTATAIKNNDEVLAWELLSKWFKEHGIPKANVLKEFVLYAQRLQSKNWKQADVFITKLFQFMHQRGAIFDMEVAELIEMYFKCHPNRWHVSHAKVSRKGECNSCKSILKLVDLSNDDFLELRNNFLERSVKKSDIFINTTKKEFDQYIKFIDTNKPFEFVLDGLNAAHTFEGVKNPKTLARQLLKIVDRLSKYSDKILVLGRFHMQQWPIYIMNKISQKATLFYTSNSSQDDPFMVYAALASGPEAFIVSQDLMRDHIARLDDPKLIWQFKRWQQTHQIYLSVSEDNKLKFLEPLRYSINIQGSMKEGWHIPYDDKIILDPYEELNNWLCVHKEP